MKSLYVYADFDWLDEIRYVGELSYEIIRGSDSYGFAFDEAWLSQYGELFLSADLNPFRGMQYTASDRDIFACFADVLPDRWGRLLFMRREQWLAQEEQRAVRRLSSFDYLLGVDDALRMGGFRFKTHPDGEFINSDARLRIPPLADIRQLEAAAWAVELSEQSDQLPEKKWLIQLLQPGTSLGGARPKANVVDTHGVLYMAKFPSTQDTYDVALWEHFCHRLASKAGIHAATTRLIPSSKGYHSLLSQRFDRLPTGQRVHFASALSLLGLVDGNNASTGHGYLDIVDFIIQHCTDVNTNLEELYRRVVFNICVGNSDDHFRNHGFLLTPKGWVLAPAYDMNPSLNQYQSLLINESTNEAKLNHVAQAAAAYMLEQNDADRILEEVTRAVSQWRDLAETLKIPHREMQYFAARLDKLTSSPT